MGYKNWRTPKGEGKIFDRLNKEFKFDLDAAASHANALLPMYCTEQGTFTKVQPVPTKRNPNPQFNPVKLSDDTGLSLAAWKGHRVWCNPPYDELLPWMNIAEMGERGSVPVSVMLLPPSTDTEWFHSILKDRGQYQWIGLSTDDYTGWRTSDGALEVRFERKRVRFEHPARSMVVDDILIYDETDPESISGDAPRAGNLVVIHRSIR